MELLAGFSSSQDSAGGWNAVVRPARARAERALERIDDATVRIFLGAFPEQGSGGKFPVITPGTLPQPPPAGSDGQAAYT